MHASRGAFGAESAIVNVLGSGPDNVVAESDHDDVVVSGLGPTAGLHRRRHVFPVLGYRLRHRRQTALALE